MTGQMTSIYGGNPESRSLASEHTSGGFENFLLFPVPSSSRRIRTKEMQIRVLTPVRARIYTPLDIREIIPMYLSVKVGPIMRFRVTSITIFVVALLSVAAAPGGRLSQGKSSSQAASVLLKAAREAMGGEAKLAAVKSLLLKGQVRTLNQLYGRDSGSAREYIANPIEIQILFPDKYVETTTYESSTKNRVGFNGSEPVPGLKPGQAPSPMWPVFLNSRQGEFARLALALLLRTDTSGRLILGNGAAVNLALEFSGLGDSPTYVDLDKATHLPSRLRYQLREFLSDGTAMGTESTWTMSVEDWRDVSNLKMPHRLSSFRAGKLYSEFLFKSIEINPPLTAADFK